MLLLLLFQDFAKHNKKTCVSRNLSNITNNKSVIEKHILFTYKFENCVCVLIVQ